MRRVKWSEISKEEYADLLKYLNDDYGVDAAIQFMDKTDEIIRQISQFPFSGQSTRKENVRKVLITKRTSLIYQVTDNMIQILLLWDNRQNPNNFEERVDSMK